MKRVEIRIGRQKYVFAAADAEADRLMEHGRRVEERNAKFRRAANVLEAGGVPRATLSPLVDEISTFNIDGVSVELIEDTVEVLSHRFTNPDGTVTDIYRKEPA
jgi:hypothetical protein